MNRQEFLYKLRIELAFLPSDELEDAIRYYDEYITEAGGDEFAVIEELGSPQKVAAEFRREYYDPKPSSEAVPAVNRADSHVYKEHKKIPVWVWIAAAVLLIGFGVPVLQTVAAGLPKIIGMLALLALLLCVAKFMSDRRDGNHGAVMSENIETCSDIRNLDFKLTAGRFVVRRGFGFGIDGSVLKSNVRDGVWYLESNFTPPVGLNGIITITVPESFTAGKIKISLGAGELLLSDISAYESDWEVGAGRLEAKGIYTKTLNVKCGVGSVSASVSLNGDVNVKCGVGSVNLTVNNDSSDFNKYASSGLGRVTIGSESISGAGGRISQNVGAYHDIKVDCGMGETKISFAKDYYTSYTERNDG